jgi:hypothetical protein
VSAPDLPEMRCEVCRDEPAAGVAAAPGVPISVAYGRGCLDANAHPWWVIVGNTAAIGGLDHAAPWWVQMVDDTIRHLGRTLVDLAAAVADLNARADEQ